jgi:hypothetical protein
MQFQSYIEELADHLYAPVQRLAFRYHSTSIEIRFTCGLDPEPWSRRVFHFHEHNKLVALMEPPANAVPQCHFLVSRVIPTPGALRRSSPPAFGRRRADQFRFISSTF